MSENYEVYQMALKTLNEVLDTIIQYQKDSISYYQDRINTIKEDTTLDDQEKEEAVNNFLASIADVHNLLKTNNRLINEMGECLDALVNNVDMIVAIEHKEKVLIDEVSHEVDNAIGVEEDAKALIESLATNDDSDLRRVLEFECQRLTRLITEVDGIISSMDTLDESGKYHLNDLVLSEKDRAQEISDKAHKMLDYCSNHIITSKEVATFANYLKENYDDLVEKKAEVSDLSVEMKHKGSLKADQIALSLIQEIIDEEVRRVNSCLSKITDVSADDGRDELVRMIDEENRRLEAYGDKLKGALKDISEGRKDLKNIVADLADSPINTYADLPFTNHNNDYNDKAKDADDYKKYSTVLNKSFWEARSLAANDNIKYPSALYEQRVKEYQNDYLIKNYNISLEELEDNIDEYRDKYAEDVYMDELYDKALNDLRKESSASVQELCEEVGGLSLVDDRVYQLLEKDLDKTQKDIEKAKADENIDSSLAINEYRKSFKVGQLLDHKEMIERQLELFKKRAKRLEEDIY